MQNRIHFFVDKLKGSEVKYWQEQNFEKYRLLIFIFLFRFDQSRGLRK